ncbi:mitochondrial escape protein 2 [Neurospora crassa OR74A]|uniref:Mitochondrial escape protein 2 n=1 Tax=Neurospora crassa (strain ATCC 24698 / 74-OR23-1A / CBS 708.71 / DSM 1257 / FGSC 987) TaxID=367110 RepID=YME2_NEUCR|nr:mitochondrial escape protein 2 [Neurospora crassa OR74A]Q873L8.2 RecName: Full=Mitochondrial escape protein 2; AltName: Full=mRNA-splicing protein 45; Flags: Precursor [Neurospora crassa OR74A]EAA33940.2 mitochondrial escape protein 2 [Neurospora crassa OR74A]|eukprot:XP_963176.2 mitochondrial escape protein 2 [Neurospora crassa OR74A]
MISAHILSRQATRPGHRGPRFTTHSTALLVQRSLGQGLPLAHRRTTRAWESTSSSTASTGSHKESGHIETAPHESLLFFNNLFPLKLSSILIWRPWTSEDLLQRFEQSSYSFIDPIRLVKRAINTHDQVPIEVTQIIPRLKDGGAFVKFTHPSDMSAAVVESKLSELLQNNPIKPWFNPFGRVKAGLVEGVPWLEDLYRLPRSRIRVEFVAAKDDASPAELSQETLYSIFRKFGKITEITSQPTDSKVLPRFAYIDFVLVRDAIMARNCMHGFVLREQGSKNATKLRLSYEQRVKAHHIWAWFTSHPRIVIPLVAALIAAFTVAVFDPIREFFVKAHVQKYFEFTNSRLYKWFKSQTSDILAFRRRKTEDAGLNALFTHRKDLIDSIQTGLLESVDTFTVVHGPRGSGKKELILDQVLKERSNVLHIDCKPVVEARGEAGTIGRLAFEVGYRPVFSWSNNISSLVDLAVQSTTGVKANFSENLESQVVKILQTTASALKQVGLSERKKEDKDADLSEDAYLEAHPERRPVIVIDHFLHKSEEKGVIYDRIADWAAALVQSNIAHVIFLTDDASYSKPLQRSLPDRVFRSVTLGDLSPDVAKKFVISQLQTDTKFAHDGQQKDSESGDQDNDNKNQKKDSNTPAPLDPTLLKELDTCITALGGRLTDLQVLARRLKIGQSPRKAVQEIIDSTASDILRMFLLSKSSTSDRKYTTEQAWYLISHLAASPSSSIPYNSVLLSNTFASSPETALEALANAELITVKSQNGMPSEIKAGKPVYQAAFQKLASDEKVKARMDLLVLTELAKMETQKIEKVEQELVMLQGLMARRPGDVSERVEYLLEKMKGGQARLKGLEKEMGVVKGQMVKG